MATPSRPSARADRRVDMEHMEEPLDRGLRRLMLENPTRIRVVPSIEDAVSESSNFSFELEGREIQFADRLNSKPGSISTEGIASLFDESPNPFASTLRLIVKSPLRDFAPKTPPYVIVQCLQTWTKSQTPATVSRLLNVDLKIVAFKIAVEQNHPAFVKLVANSYEMENNKDELLPYVKELMDTFNFKVACQCVTLLKLQDNVQVEDLFWPLILQDKLNIVFEYLDASPAQAMKVIKYLDKIIGGNIKAEVQNYLVCHPVPGVKWDKLKNKTLSKLAIKLCNRYKIPLETCENISNKRAMAGMNYLIRQRYDEKVINYNVWNDRVNDTLENNPEILIEFIKTLGMFDPKEAGKWATRYNVTQDMLPGWLRKIYEYEEEDWDESPGPSQVVQYHKFPAAAPEIVFVDSVQVFESRVLPELAENYVVGLDSEWKPSFGTKNVAVSLIQIATLRKVFIFDVLPSSEVTHSNLWPVLIDRVFHNMNIIKVGFGIDNDMREITSSVPGFDSIKFRRPGYLELSKLWKSCMFAKMRVPYPKVNKGERLNSIVEQCFGVQLDKSEQCSNWENRPLRDSQLEYAALDAYVLIEIYEMLNSLCQECGVDFEKMCYKVMSHSNNRRRKGPPRYAKKKN